MLFADRPGRRGRPSAALTGDSWFMRFASSEEPGEEASGAGGAEREDEGRRRGRGRLSQRLRAYAAVTPKDRSTVQCFLLLVIVVVVVLRPRLHRPNRPG